jgi:hypothetical protein
MHLRKALAVGAAVLAVGLLGLTSSASAAGGAIGHVGVNGSTAAGAVAIDGVFHNGNATVRGSTYGCTGGTVSGTVKRGAVNANPELSFGTMSLVCATAFGDATFTVGAGCSVDVKFAGTVNDGTSDTGVPGTATMPALCVNLSIGGLCTAKVSGTIGAAFDETVMTIGGVNYQRLTLNGTGLALNNVAGCLGLIVNGPVTLNAITFDLKVTTGGTTTGIDFRVNP